ncbi:MAG: Spi family protease inhibitor [Bacteroidales bacterium]|nr:Spi family protease inhibitor [Bacteroidales bacterium]
MKRIVFSIGLVLLMSLGAFCHPISPAKARHLAETFWQQSGCETRSGVSADALVDITAQTAFSHLYIFSHAGGFVILSGDDCAKPILAYSTSGGFDAENIPAAVRDWLFTYENRIEDAINQHH